MKREATDKLIYFFFPFTCFILSTVVFIILLTVRLGIYK